MSDDDTPQEQPIDSPVMAKLIAELGDKPVEYWQARDPRLLRDSQFKDAIIAAQNQMLAEQAEPTAEQIIANYYMRRGRNKKLTLRQHIKESGTTLSEGYIRKVKVAYDKRHKARKRR